MSQQKKPTKPRRATRTRAVNPADGITTAQNVYKQILAKADPDSQKKEK